MVLGPAQGAALQAGLQGASCAAGEALEKLSGVVFHWDTGFCFSTQLQRFLYVNAEPRFVKDAWQPLLWLALLNLTQTFFC